MKGIICIISTLLTLCVSMQSQDIRQSMLNSPMVQAGLFEYLSKIPNGHEVNFGFYDRSEFKDATFGRPYQIYRIQYDSLEYESKEFRETNKWYIPVILDNTYRCFLYVRNNANEFRIVGIGSMEIAKDIGLCENMYKSSNQTHDLIILDEINNFLYLVSNDGLFTPVRPTRLSDSSKLYTSVKRSSVVNELLSFVIEIKKL